MIDAIIFDVGETLIDETHEYGTWADWLDIPRHTFSSVFGAVIALGWTTGKSFNISAQVSTFMLSVSGVPQQINRRSLTKMTCTRTSDRASQNCKIRVSG
jgi:hypothetical protein